MKRAIVVVTLGMLGLGVTGCASDHPEKLPPTDDPVVWAGRLCSSLSPLAGLRNVRPKFDPNDPATSKDSLSRYFDDTQARVSESLLGLEQVGPSPISGGDEVAGKVRGGLERLRGAFASARSEVEAVDPTDPVELGAKLPDLLGRLATAAADPDLSTIGDNAALNDAVHRSPSCALMNGNVPPSPPN
jgi:hypothetical protein